ncbi:hypothetical protein BKA61DRAFT_583310 [Leptodontidium sp. MPI-SDFR-AT-0119]|nr:hypothetical protein BKA61DRAFT_583310 [Leptodontidium sp. MPI-SDFR-AT-0119]
MTPTETNFRSCLPDLSKGKFSDLSTHDATSWKERSMQVPFLHDLIHGWLKLGDEPFKGITSDGRVIPELYDYEDHGIDSALIAEAAKDVFNLCSAEQLAAMRQPLNSKTWRSWSNPEIYFSPFGLRLEETSKELSDSILRVMELTLSPEGYEKVSNARWVNKFLGDLCNGRSVLNEFSYNFQIFGEPSDQAPWGWSIFGHHLCMCAFINRRQLHMAPVFLGAEPNEIDEGPHKETTMMKAEERMGLELMQSLSPEQQKEAQVYEKNRHICGAFQDNRIVPYEGVNIGCLSEKHQSMMMEILSEFLIYLPAASLKMRLLQITKHLSETYFSWIGGYSDSDPFYFRIQSPVIVVEFDHHSGVFLSNTQPQRFHIHTIARAPNGGDYGNALREPENRVQ